MTPLDDPGQNCVFHLQGKNYYISYWDLVTFNLSYSMQIENDSSHGNDNAAISNNIMVITDLLEEH